MPSTEPIVHYPDRPSPHGPVVKVWAQHVPGFDRYEVRVVRYAPGPGNMGLTSEYLDADGIWAFYDHFEQIPTVAQISGARVTLNTEETIAAGITARVLHSLEAAGFHAEEG